MHLVYPPQFCIAFDFSWDDSNTQRKLEIMVMHNFSGGGGRGGDKVHYGLRKNSEGKVTVE